MTDNITTGSINSPEQPGATMELSNDKKSAVLLDLLTELMGEMKSSSGKKLKPASATIAIESEPEVVAVEPVEDEDEEQEVPEELETPEDEAAESDEQQLAEYLEGEEQHEVPVEKLSGASARLAKRLAAAKR